MSHVFRILLFTVAVTAFYTYVGHMVPQKEVHPPAELEIQPGMSPEEMAAVGKAIAEGKGTCFACHTLGSSGPARFPDLAGIATTAANRKPGMDALAYLAESLYEPEAYIVPGFNAGMPPANKAPIGLSDSEILCVIAYLQSLGGEPSVTLETRLPFGGAQ